ncbi:MAG: HPr kinase/phosphorylase [Octadecabacter sp.]
MLSVAPKNGPDGLLQLHSSTVVMNGNAVAFVGKSGTGKSAMAFRMLSLGATLLADDITWFSSTSDGLHAQCPQALSGRIEARGVGILNAVPASPAPLVLIVDMGTPEVDRLPPLRNVTLLGHVITLLHTPAIPHFADAIRHYMLHGRVE